MLDIFTWGWLMVRYIHTGALWTDHLLGGHAFWFDIFTQGERILSAERVDPKQVFYYDLYCFLMCMYWCHFNKVRLCLWEWEQGQKGCPNPLATGNTLLCGWCCEHKQHYVYVCSTKETFINYVQKFGSGCFRML